MTQANYRAISVSVTYQSWILVSPLKNINIVTRERRPLKDKTAYFFKETPQLLWIRWLFLKKVEIMDICRWKKLIV